MLDPVVAAQIVVDAMILARVRGLRVLGDVPGHPFHGNQWTNAAHATAADLSGVTPDAPLKTYKAYHVTKKENVASILEKGFDITKVKPRWQNDYAVSLSRGAKAATDYFSKVDPTTMKPVGMDTKKYSLLEVTVKGRLFKGEAFQRAPVGYASSAKDWTHQLVHTHGYDGQDQGHTIFVNNPKSIVSVREVSPKVKTLGGSGSGNFGHAGRPGEIGGSGGGLKVYHGTSEEALRAIRKEGLVPHGSKGGDAWAISIGRGSPDNFLSQTEVNGRRASVFVAEHKETAESFAEYATRMHPGSEAAVIEITIPESEVGRIKEDELSLEKRFEGRIPPTWITKAEVFHPTPERRHDPKYPIADQESAYKIFGYDTVADTHKLYFVLLMDGQPATLGGVGSGNFGHSGRPGEVGGSTVAGGTLDNHAALDIAASVPAISQSEREQLIRNVDQLKRSATQAGVPLNKVRILDEHNTFVQGGQQFEELGHYSAKDNEIVFNARPLAAETTQSTEIAFAHENTHREWKEFSDLVGLKSGDPNAASPEARAAVHTLMRDRAQLAKDDGITPYSQAYWRDYQRDLKDANERSIDPDVNKLHTDQANHSFLRATNETLAEISANELKRAFGHAPGSVGSTKSYDPTPIWRTLHSNIKAAVKTRG